MDFEGIIEQAKVLFKNFGWYSVALVVGTCVIMYGLNFLYKKMMRSEKLSRLRKSISAVSVYGVAMGLIALFTYTVLKKPISIEYVLGASLPCGTLAHGLWAIYKFVRDYGFAPLIAKLKDSGVIEKELKKLGLDKKIYKAIISQVENYLDGKNVKDINGYLREELAITNKVSEYIKGFVSSDKSSQVIKLIKEKIKSDYEA